MSGSGNDITASRRRVLQVLGGSLAATGAATTVSGRSGRGRTGPDEWTTFQNDARNTGFSPGPSPTTEPTVRWTASSGARGYPPAVHDGVAYLTSNGLTAVDMSTGDVLWERWFGSPLGTPTVRDGKLYLAGDTYISRVDIADRTTDWEFWLPDGYRPRSSPTVVDGTMVVSLDGPRTDDDRRGRVYAFDAASGDVQWQFEAAYDRMLSTPAIQRGTVYVGSGWAPDHEGTLYALDLATGEEQWSFTHTSSPRHGGGGVYSPTVRGQTVYAGGGFVLYALDARTGEVQWQYDDYTERGGGNFGRSSPSIGFGTLVGATDGGNVFGVHPATGREQWAFQLGAPDESRTNEGSPTIASGTAYVTSASSFFADTTEGRVHAIDIKSGAERWQFVTDENIESSITIADGALLVPTTDGTVYALEDTGGR